MVKHSVAPWTDFSRANALVGRRFLPDSCLWRSARRPSGSSVCNCTVEQTETRRNRPGSAKVGSSGMGVESRERPSPRASGRWRQDLQGTILMLNVLISNTPLFFFSPAMIQASASWHTEPEIVAAWGAFGTIFTAIAVAHTLYAPREVVWWNWRRIVLLGISLGLAVGSQFSMIVVAPIALALMLYVAPIRRKAALVIWGAGCTVGLALLFVVYFHPRAFWEGMRHAAFWGATWRG